MPTKSDTEITTLQREIDQGHIDLDTTPAQLYDQFPELLKNYKNNPKTWKTFESYWGRMRKDERKKRNENGKSNESWWRYQFGFCQYLTFRLLLLFVLQTIVFRISILLLAPTLAHPTKWRKWPAQNNHFLIKL